MEYANADHLIRKLSMFNKTDATKKLTEFYASARFRNDPAQFQKQYTDGANDGGIDFYHREDSTYVIFQTKFSANPKRVNEEEVKKELRKLKNTLTKENPNQDAADFVNALRRDASQKTTLLEILWLTTNIVDDSLKKEIQHDLEEFRKANRWVLGIDFVAVDKYVLDSVIYDVKHGFVPYTGKKVLKLEPGQWIETVWDDTGVYSVVCTANVNDLLRWFRNAEDATKFLQKNVRGFVGEKKINKAIAKSYAGSPEWFWYKHNGIIILTDALSVERTKLELILRNPQVVNGGQTLTALYLAYDKQGRRDNTAKVLVRIYRLPYDNTETYQRSIDIISALNSQNKIEASDLRSTDPRQVRLEQLLLKIGDGYRYIRKRAKDERATKYQISMRNLGLLYWVCKKNMPHEGVRGNREEVFEDQSKYDEAFNEAAINRELGSNHVALRYVQVWVIDQLLMHIELPKQDKEYWKYTRWYVLSDIYWKLAGWRSSRFSQSWQDWVRFLDSDHFERAVREYARAMSRVAREMIPWREEPRKFLKRAEATRKFGQRAHKRLFDNVMNKSYIRFERELDI